MCGIKTVIICGKPDAKLIIYTRLCYKSRLPTG
jgi:hypothetical protein